MTTRKELRYSKSLLNPLSPLFKRNSAEGAIDDDAHTKNGYLNKLERFLTTTRNDAGGGGRLNGSPRPPSF